MAGGLPDDWNDLTDAEKQDQIDRREIAGKLDQAISFLRTSARSSYFTGYSINETMEARIKSIGENKKMRPVGDTSPTSPAYFTPEELRETQLGRLAAFERMINDAIDAAAKLDTPTDTVET